MKNFISYATCFLLMFSFACDDEESNSDKIQLTLVSKSGFTLANSVEELRESIRQTLLDEEELYEINNIEYLYYEDYTYAIVTYETLDGRMGNVIYGNSPIGTKGDGISNSRFGSNCWKGTCSGTCGCLISVTPPAIAGEQPTFKCSCTECTLTLETC